MSGIRRRRMQVIIRHLQLNSGNSIDNAYHCDITMITVNSMPMNANKEVSVRVFNGWILLPLLILFLLGSITLFIYSIVRGDQMYNHPIWSYFVIGILAMITAFICLGGLFTLQPNEARVLVLFGEYKGTVRESGFHWGNPFYSNGAECRRASATDEKPAKREHAPKPTGPRQQDLAAGAQPEQRQTEGERQAGQPDRDRGGDGVAGAGHRPGDVRRGRLRELRAHSERVGDSAPGQRIRL